MRVVDINGIGEPARLAADEIWRVAPRACRDDPAAFDAGSIREKRLSTDRPMLVAMPCKLTDLEQRREAYRAAGSPEVLRLCPGPERHGFPLEPWAVSPIPEFCEREEMAVAIDLAASASHYPWAEVVRFARGYPRLAVIALGAPLTGPTASRALEATPNLVLETSALTSEAEATLFAALVSSHGAYRFAYGSGEAARSPGLACHALGDTAARAVLSETADQLGSGKWSATHL